MYEDKTLVCKECGKEFVFTAGEQEFYAERGFQNEPQRCKSCRDARKILLQRNAFFFRQLAELLRMAAKHKYAASGIALLAVQIKIRCGELAYGISEALHFFVLFAVETAHGVSSFTPLQSWG